MNNKIRTNGTDWAKIQTDLGVHFQNEKLLIQAFTHSSYVNENNMASKMSNERLEFLGDAVLEIAISQYLYSKFPDMLEGELTKLRAAIVCEQSFVSFAEDLNFGTYVLLGRGEDRSGGRARSSLLADVFESFFGALYIDQGMDEVQRLLKKIVFPKINEGSFSQVVDHKSLLQEKVQKAHNSILKYEVILESGPAHDRVFDVEVLVNNEIIGSGTGRSKKEAEQNAAAKALENMND